jgi:hypothetical protein
MQVHEVVHYSRLQIIVNPVDDHLAANVDNLAICHVGLVFIQSFVDALVHRYPLSEIFRRLFGVLAFVVRASRFHFANVGHDHILVVALALNKECLDTLGVANILDPTTAAFGAVCGVQNGDKIVLTLEPLQHVRNGCFCSGLAKALTLLIVGIEEVCCGLWGVVATI